MDVIVGAGGVAKQDDPLLGLVAAGEPKALLPLAGQPMVQWTLDAIANSSQVDDVFIVGLTEAHGVSCGTKPVHFLPDAGSLLDNAMAGARAIGELRAGDSPVLWVSADVPLITTEMVDWMIAQVGATEHDLYYAIIAREVMESRFPESRRSYTRLKEGAVCGGDINAFAASMMSDSNPMWQQIVAARKSMFKVTSLVGLWPLLQLAAGQMSKARAEQLVRDRLGIRGRLIDCPYAEIGMDVDKPFQYEIAVRELSSR